MQGYVTRLGQKTGNTNGRAWAMHSVQLDGNKWLGAGFDKPSCNEGDLINYDIVQKGQYENIENIEVVGNAPAGGSNSNGKPPPVNTTQLSIHYQSSRKDAITTMAFLLENDIVKLPAKQADKYDAAMSLIDEIAAGYFFKLESVIEAGGLDTVDALPTDPVPF